MDENSFPWMLETPSPSEFVLFPMNDGYASLDEHLIFENRTNQIIILMVHVKQIPILILLMY